MPLPSPAGPGLPGSLVVGMNAAKGLALGSGLPLVGINHLEAHLYSAWLHAARSELPLPEPRFPAAGPDRLRRAYRAGADDRITCTYQRLGATLDDAAGEAFDKVARLLGLAYPGGPAIQKAAEGGNPDALRFPARLAGRAAGTSPSAG